MVVVSIVVCSLIYSYLNAFMGSIPAARRAGNQQASSATSATNSEMPIKMG